MAGHKQLMCEGIIENLEVQMGNYVLNDSFFVALIGSVDAILGIQWSEKLGTYAINNVEYFMKLK